MMKTNIRWGYWPADFEEEPDQAGQQVLNEEITACMKAVVKSLESHKRELDILKDRIDSLEARPRTESCLCGGLK